MQDDYAKAHKEAFRCAFDFLKDRFPPRQDPEWWQYTAAEAASLSDGHKNNPLVVILLSAVYSYLEQEMKGAEHGKGNN